jgi:D-aspartate ligase
VAVREAIPVSISRRVQKLSSPQGAIVLGGDYRGLGIVRNLGRRGIPVWVIKDRHTVAAHSKYADRVIDWPAGSDEDRVERLQGLGKTVIPGYWALFPTTDEMTAVVARSCENLNRTFSITTAPLDVVEIGQDKRKTHALAAANGIGFPQTWLPRDLREVEGLNLSYPVIIKPAVKDRANPLTHDKAWRVVSRSELIRQYQVACRLLPADQIMIQDMIPGDGRFQYSYAGVMREGRPVADVVAKRLRQYPADLGLHSTYVVSVEDAEVEEAGRRIAADLNFTGLLEVEFKRDPRDFSLNLLDINTRVWGWHTLGVRSGVDFAYINWQMLQGKDVAPVRVPPGETWMRFLTDCLTSLSQIRSGRATVGGYVKSVVGRHDAAVMGVDDPLPMILDAPMLAYLRWTRVLR